MSEFATGAKEWAARRSRSAVWAWRFAGFSVPVLIVSLFAHRSGYADTISALAVFGCAFLLAAVAVVLALAAFISIWNRGGAGLGRAVMAFLVGITVVAIPIAAGVQIWRLPLINDITTDPDALPAFEALASIRTTVGAPADYAGTETFLSQIEAYPLVVPVRFETEFETVRTIVLEEVRKAGWQIVATRNSEDGAPREAVVEAVASTTIFAFKDDIMIRIVETGEVVRIDMRSASRFGEHDLGTNARRIVGFLERVEDAIKDAARV